MSIFIQKKLTIFLNLKRFIRILTGIFIRNDGNFATIPFPQ